MKRRGTKRSRKTAGLSGPSSSAEDLIDESRRNEIINAFENALSKRNDRIVANNSSEQQQEEQQQLLLLPLSDVRKVLSRKLQLEGIRTDEIIEYFGSKNDNDDNDNDDDDLSLGLDVNQFLNFAASKTIQKQKSDKAFALIDVAEKGVVILEDLQRVTQELDEDWTDEELKEMIDFIDNESGEGDGFVSRTHFFQLARKVNL